MAPQEPQKKSQEKVLNPTVLRLGLVSFLQDLSSEMLVPIAPIFLTTVLGANLTSVGFIEGLAEALSSILKIFGGIWSDHLQKRKIFIFFGYLLATIAKPLTGLSTSWIHVLAARSLDRIGKGIRTAPRDAMLADAVPKEKMGEAFGWHRAMDTMGAALGPLLTILFLHFYSQELRPLYFFAFFPGVLAVLLVLTLKEKVKVNSSGQVTGPPRVRVPLSGEMKSFICVWGIFSIANSADAFLIMKMQVTGFSLTKIILIYCFFNLVYAITSPSLGKISDAWGKEKVIQVGLLLFALIYFGFSHAQSTLEFIVLFGLYGIYMATTEGVSKAFVVDLGGASSKATSLGFFAGVTGIATIIASTIGGFLWDSRGPQATFYYGAAFSLLALILMQVRRILHKK